MDLYSPHQLQTFDELKKWCCDLYNRLEYSGYFSYAFADENMGSPQLGRHGTADPGIDEFVDEAGNDTGIETYAFAPNEFVSGQFELQHDYKEGSDITFHIHWQGIAAPAGGTDNVKWEIQYTIARDDTTLDACPTALTKETAFTTRYAVVRTTMAAITGTSLKIGDQVLFRLKRIAASADEYAGDALLVTCGVHYQRDGIGSRKATTKY